MKNDEPSRTETGRSGVVEWYDDKMETSFSNVINVQATREQIEIFFGITRTWNAESDTTMRIDLNHRQILTPLAAKRLSRVLADVLATYEQRHGALKIDDRIAKLRVDGLRAQIEGIRVERARLRADYTQAPYFLLLTVSLRDNPVPTNQLRSDVAGIRDGDVVGKRITVMLNIRLLRQEGNLDLY